LELLGFGTLSALRYSKEYNASEHRTMNKVVHHCHNSSETNVLQIHRELDILGFCPEVS
jgi:hypothetical protein